MQNQSSMLLSVIIPAYNEERRLPATLDQVVQYLTAQSYFAEIILVDDGSTDGTQQIARHYSSDHVPLRIVQHPDLLNHGKGAAVCRGMLEARGRYRLFMDADNSTTVDQVERCWPWCEAGYALVIGSRDVAGAEISIHQAWYKELAGDLGNLIIRLLVVPGVADTQAGFKLVEGACAEDLFPRLTIERWGFDIELLAIAQRRDYRIKEVPIRWANSPESKVPAAAYLEVLGEVWRIRRNLRSGVYD